MADVELIVVMKDIKVAEASERFLALFPNDEIKLKADAVPDPETGRYDEGDYEPAYPTLKLWVQEWLARQLWGAIIRGDDKIYKAEQVKLTDRSVYLD